MANDTSRTSSPDGSIGGRTHIPSAVAAEAGTDHRRAAGTLRMQAVAAEGSNHPDPGEHLETAYLISRADAGHIVMSTHPEEGSTGPVLVDSSLC